MPTKRFSTIDAFKDTNLNGRGRQSHRHPRWSNRFLRAGRAELLKATGSAALVAVRALSGRSSQA